LSDDLDRLIPAEEALERVLRHAETLSDETVALNQAGGRVLASDLAARRTQPPFDASAMDGFAVRHGDLANLPTQLKIVGESRAGVSFKGVLHPGEAVRIFTGAVVPQGADTIIIQEDTKFDSESVTVLESGSVGTYIRQAGLDFEEGERLLERGSVLNARRLSLAASMGHGHLPVVRKPFVAVFATGDELVLPGQTTTPDQIIASNTFGLRHSLKAAGATILDGGIVADDRDALSAVFEHAISKKVDVIVTTGGASVGDHDLVLPIARKLGFTFEIAKIAMRPGKPFLFGHISRDGHTTLLCGLAGNPVSSLVAAAVFVRPLVMKMAGLPAEFTQALKGVLATPLPANGQRQDYLRGEIETVAGKQPRVHVFNRQDSSMLATFARANCLIIRPVNAPSANVGDTVSYLPLD